MQSICTNIQEPTLFLLFQLKQITWDVEKLLLICKATLRILKIFFFPLILSTFVTWIYYNFDWKSFNHLLGPTYNPWLRFSIACTITCSTFLWYMEHKYSKLRCGGYLFHQVGFTISALIKINQLIVQDELCIERFTFQFLYYLFPYHLAHSCKQYWIFDSQILSLAKLDFFVV